MVSTILLIGFNRPELLKRRISEIAKNRPKNLHISIDGCSDKSLTKRIQSAVEESVEKYIIDSKVQIKYQGTNLGLSKHITCAVTKVLEEEDSVLVLEDDIRIGPNFLQNIIQAWKNNPNPSSIGTIGGFSSLPSNLPIRGNFWRQTKYFSAWGWSISSKNWEKYNRHLPQVNIEKQLTDSPAWLSLSDYQRDTWLNRFRKVINNPDFTWDYQFQYMTFKENFVNLLPLKRICENEGFHDSRSSNTKSPRPLWMGKTGINESAFAENLNPHISSLIEDYIDSFTISGDSKARSRLNQIRMRLGRNIG